MGIRLPPRGAKAPSPIETPVLVSVDVARRKRRLRLDGIVRTVITLGCNRCAEPAAECVFSNFALLLSEDPIKEPEEINMGTLLGEDRAGDNDDESIDIDDQLYFPAEVKEIDISKHIRDIVHVEITINAVCDVNCKGLCLRCGTNLNRSSCSCGKEMVPEKGKGNGGPLKDEDPIKEPEEINMGTLLGEDRAGDNDDESIDIDDQLYFPAEVKEIDISKHIRDIVHVEITINAVCDVNCKGLCLRCGTNLNRSSCSCGKEMVPEKGKGNGGPLKELRKQMQQKYT
ncbi:hypothetical protein ACMD2_06294 [Ananas comosus]|uniref:Large ribosomal RNA subunit accumulation protein YCED homolog 1, chloroplastic n=1 Tax=Ananas comosus TaxID=4615 RepID=A0A199W3E3_ANACO|nr:hypothetical protein ACMD2_06294 [Ananas comosus]